jgi:Tol biopolymer transport system component
MNPAWSPDGTRIAFVTTRNGRAEIFVMQADGSDQKTLVSRPNGSTIDARWSPDGSHMAFVFIPEQPPPGQAPEPPAIYTIDLTSGQLTRLSR